MIIPKNSILYYYLHDLSISHGINLIVLTYLTALGGYLKFTKNHIIVLLIILFMATSWPDITTFYRDELFEKDKKKKKVKYEIITLFITEILVLFFLIFPLYTIYNKKNAIFFSYLIAIFLLFINNDINMEYHFLVNILIILTYLFISYVIYLISDYLIKRFKR